MKMDKYQVGKSKHWLFCKWWMRIRPVVSQAIPCPSSCRCVEFYVPWWAWPFELIHRAIFGKTKINRLKK